MNKKITVQNSAGELSYCILLGEKNLEDQFNRVVYGTPKPRHGMCVRFDGSNIAIVDYYHDETVAVLKVVSIEDTDSEPVLQWGNLQAK